MRRSKRPDNVESHVLYADSHLVVDRSRWLVTLNGQPLDLTATERRLLFLLVENAGRVLTTAQILENVWGPEYVSDIDYVKLYIWRLRQKIEEDPRNPRYLLTERGIGYRFVRAG
jgi:two-component system KDP operon response regulator KdpE